MKKKLLVVAVSVFILTGFSAWFHPHVNSNPQSQNSVNNAVSQNITTYSLNGYTMTFTGGNKVSMGNGQMSFTMSFTVLSVNRNNFSQGTPVSTSFNRIDDKAQNSVAVINTYSNGAVTYIFNTGFNGFELDYVIPPVTGLYILFNITLGQASSINSGGFVYSHNSSNSQEYGSYPVSTGYSDWSLNYYDSNTDSGGFSWMQIQAQHMITFEKVSITPNGDYMDLMTGPYNSDGQATWSYSGIVISSG